MSLSYAGVPLMAPMDGLQELIEVHGGLAEIAALQMPSWTGLNGREADFGPARKGKLGRLLWPTGASRFAQAHFVATQSQLDAIKKKIFLVTGQPGSVAATGATLKIWDEAAEEPDTPGDLPPGTEISTEMYLLAPWPLFNHDDADPDIERLWLLTFVDVRYFWWQKSADIEVIGGFTTWEDLLDDIKTSLGETDFTVPEIDADYLKPHPSLSTSFGYIPPLLDAVAYSIGRRVIRRLDGSVELQTPEAGRSESLNLLADWREYTLQGGSMAIGDDEEPASKIDLWATAPASVAMSFPEVDIRVAEVDSDLTDIVQETANLNTLGVTEYRNQTQRSGSHLVRNTAIRWMDDVAVENAAEITNLTKVWAKDWYRWQLADQYRMYPTIVPWDGTGMVDFVEWQAWPKLATRVTRGPLNDMANTVYHYTVVDGVCPHSPEFDDFFPARLDAHSGSPPEYSWTEMVWNADTDTIGVLANGRVGTYTLPRSWPASELNDIVVVNDTIVWMKRGFIPALPARVSITKTATGNGTSIKDAFSLWIEGATGGTYYFSWDGVNTTAIAWNAVNTAVKTALETASGLTLTTPTGAGTRVSPWLFTITSANYAAHTVIPYPCGLKDGSGFRFAAGTASDFEPCLADALPAATGAYKVVVQQTADKCLAVVTVDDCEPPIFLNGGTLP